MAFFKKTRDQLKANGLVSHLEYALQHFRPRYIWQCQHHLRGAQKFLVKVRNAKAAYILSDVGWQYVAQLAVLLQAQLRRNGFDELAQGTTQIGHYACLILSERENPVSEAELQSPPVDEDGFLVEPPRPPRVFREPW